MSNNPMKRPPHKRKLRSLTVSVLTDFGVTIERPMRKGDYNWRAKAGQRKDKVNV